MTMAHVFVGKAELLRAKEQGGIGGCKMLVYDLASCLQAIERDVEIAVSGRRGSNNKLAIRYGGRKCFEDLRLFQNVTRSDGGAGLFEGCIVRLHQTQACEAEIAHSASNRPDIKRVAGRDKNDAECVIGHCRLLFEVCVPLQSLFVELEQTARLLVADALLANGHLDILAELV